MIKVKVPATTANIGPGFDTLGLALNVYNTFSFEEIDSGIEISGMHEEYNNENNLVYKSMQITFDKLDYEPKGIRLIIEGDIPLSSGLGSSAACIVGGIIGANEIAKGNLTKEEILKLASQIEGHPDNVAPAIFGGLIISLVDDSEIFYNKLDIEEKFKFVALVPDFSLFTRKARAVLPLTVDYKEAVNNVGRVSMLLSSLVNGRLDLLKHGLKDNLHQPYRGKLINNYFDITEKCQELGIIGTYLSGAGPTIMCLKEKDDTEFNEKIKKYLETLDDNWVVKELEIDFEGVEVFEE